MSGIPDGLDGESQAKVKRTLFNGGVPIEVCLLQTGYNIQRISPLRLDSGDSRGLTQCIGHHRRCPGRRHQHSAPKLVIQVADTA